MELKNSEILSIMNTLHSNSEDALIRRKMPTKILYALHRSIPEIESAYKAYEETLTDICGQYGVTPQNVSDVPKEKVPECNAAIVELLNTDVLVDIHPIDMSVLENYDDEKYDPLTLSELETLYLFAKKEDE